MKPLHKYLLIGCGSTSALALIGVILLVIWMANAPEGGVRVANEMDQYALDYIADHKLLNPGEEILAYYDVTISMDSTEAAILTTDRVFYHKNGNTIAIQYEDIEEVNHRTETMIGDIFEIRDSSGRVMKIEVAPFNQGETFKNILMNMWAETGGAVDAP